jgi:hypothetical protein
MRPDISPRVHNHEHIRQIKSTTDPVKHHGFPHRPIADRAEDTRSKKPRVEGEKRGRRRVTGEKGVVVVVVLAVEDESRLQFLPLVRLDSRSSYLSWQSRKRANYKSP